MPVEQAQYDTLKEKHDVLKAQNKSQASALEAYSKDFKRVQEADEIVAANAEEMDALKTQVSELQAQVAALEADNKSKDKRLKAAEKKIDAAHKIAEGIAELG